MQTTVNTVEQLKLIFFQTKMKLHCLFFPLTMLSRDCEDVIENESLRFEKAGRKDG